MRRHKLHTISKVLIILVFTITSYSPALAITATDLDAIGLDALYYGGIDDFRQFFGVGGYYTLDGITINDADALASAIDSYIDDKAPSNSPLRGLGSYFVSGSIRADVNPMFLVAIARKETSFGTTGVATNGSNNAFGRKATSSQPHVETNDLWYKYDSFRESLDGGGDKDDQPSYMRRRFLEQDGVNTIDDVMAIYAPRSDDNPTDLYIQEVRQWIGEIMDLAGDSIGSGFTDGEWVWPLQASGARISSCFGRRFHPIDLVWKDHNGVDIAAGGGNPVVAAADGEVRMSGWSSGGGGWMVIIDHGNNVQTRYLHNRDRPFVRVGETVRAGEQIAIEGSTGSSTAPHLHFEVIRNGSPANPLLEMQAPGSVNLIRTATCTPASTGGQV